jgi:hypothetical protein
MVTVMKQLVGVMVRGWQVGVLVTAMGCQLQVMARVTCWHLLVMGSVVGCQP